MNINDTIAAVSTPRGKGGVALLRVSGDEALAIAEKVFFPASGKPLSSYAPRQAVYGSIETVEPNGSRRRIDDGIATFFAAPASFTGEDTVEICCHGGLIVTSAVLEALLCVGARQAEAGEFTRRAFVGGKLGLSEAEALSSLLDAKTHDQLRLSRASLDGKFSREVSSLYSELRTVIGDIYAHVDFPEEDLAGLSREQIVSSIADIRDRICRLAATYRTGKAVAEGVRTVICGRTNSGKSSLYNALVGSEEAIVTDIEGTTRDLLETTVAFGGITLRLCDTAGLRDNTSDAVEKIGIARAREKMENAELLFVLLDTSRSPDADELSLLEWVKRGAVPAIIVKTKSDLPSLWTPDTELLPTVSLSTKTGEGLDSLARAVAVLMSDESLDLSRDPIAMTARQYASLSRAAEALGGCLSALASGLPEDIVGSDIELAMSALSELDGREVGLDIVSEIFSHFCVGK